MPEPTASLSADEHAEIREAGLFQAMFGPCDAQPDLRCYLLLDAAASSDIPVCLAGFGADARCLFDGSTRDDLEDVAPWLVETRRHQPVAAWYAGEGHGQNWGIIIHSTLEPARLKTRLKRFLRVEDEAGEELFFKFYRPRNLNAILPDFDDDQRASFFHGIDAILAEDRGNPDGLRRHLPDGPTEGEPVDLVALGRTLTTRQRDPAADALQLLARLKQQS